MVYFNIDDVSRVPFPLFLLPLYFADSLLQYVLSLFILVLTSHYLRLKKYYISKINPVIIMFQNLEGLPKTAWLLRIPEIKRKRP